MRGGGVEMCRAWLLGAAQEPKVYVRFSDADIAWSAFVAPESMPTEYLYVRAAPAASGAVSATGVVKNVDKVVRLYVFDRAGHAAAATG